jgi:aminoglycoside phosphotransferase (APT) family kinase protein
MLTAIRQGLPDSLLETLPRPIHTVEFNGWPALVVTALSGTPMTVSYLARRHTADRSRVAADLHAASSWLGQLQETTSTEHTPIDIVLGLAERLHNRFGEDNGLGDVADRLAEIDARLQGATTPRTAVHGDFWFGNLLLQCGEVSGVVDWEAGILSGEPARDLARFALSYALYLDRRTRKSRPVTGHPGLRAERWGAAVEFAIRGSGWFPEQFQGFLQDGLTRLEASPSLWRDIALAGIAEIAARSDDDEFASRHLSLFRRLAGRPRREGTT